ncbi:MAG: hypothetical protein FWH31_07905 [Streptococcaceae bacterium]|nr:hypothetical protein [Streptococcaceae bacterium]
MSIDFSAKVREKNNRVEALRQEKREKMADSKIPSYKFPNQYNSLPMGQLPPSERGSADIREDGE